MVEFYKLVKNLLQNPNEFGIITLVIKKAIENYSKEMLFL